MSKVRNLPLPECPLQFQSFATAHGTHAARCKRLSFALSYFEPRHDMSRQQLQEYFQVQREWEWDTKENPVMGTSAAAIFKHSLWVGPARLEGGDGSVCRTSSLHSYLLYIPLQQFNESGVAVPALSLIPRQECRHVIPPQFVKAETQEAQLGILRWMHTMSPE